MNCWSTRRLHSSFKLLAKFSVWTLILTSAARADVVVVVNRSSASCKFQVGSPGLSPQNVTLAPGAIRAFPMRAEAVLKCPATETTEYQLDSNTVYYFQETNDNKRTLRQIDLGDDLRSRRGRDLGQPVTSAKPLPIRVRLLVDDGERRPQSSWESRLRSRIQSASDILTPLLQIRLEVDSVGTWRSTPDQGPEMMSEFVRNVPPIRNGLVIGFASHMLNFPQEDEVDVVQSALNSHLLLIERAGTMTESEHLEILLHGIGHFLGAIHSPEPDSIMRVGLPDGRARRKDHRMIFDPVNVLAMNLICEELRLRNAWKIDEFTDGTRYRLDQIYGVMARANANDRFPIRFGNGVQRKPEPNNDPNRPEVPRPNQPLPRLAGIRTVLDAIQDAARRHAPSSSAANRSSSSPGPQLGDALLEHYVRAAAGSANQVDPEHAPRAFLIGLGLGLDDSGVLRNNPLTRPIAVNIESDEQHALRMRSLGQPTAHGRRDLAQHFATSCFLTAEFGRVASEAAGYAKEVFDSQGGSGFSFADLAMDYAGVQLAMNVLNGNWKLDELSQKFSIAEFVPTVSDLDEGLDSVAFQQKYGPPSDRRYLDLVQRIRSRISNLPAYRASR